ncbi:MAG TPA: ribonucleotide reductase N-terminal alpha domain-containing protein, partial [Burkholderiaceae bacterium]|nr:ribonucleotide reductase N-terminal alpha domain-containing protein [Burkholderiaceae bacterium]
MIKNIIKRDGRTEPYIPSKLNGWGRWAAANLGDKVDWSSIVLQAVSSMPDTVTTVELQEKLIQNCLDEGTWSYYLMAGRLYASHLHKIIHGSTIPTVKQLHDQMIADNVMVRMDYSDEEYQQVESFIDHERDYDTPHFSLHYIRRKYSLQNRVTHKEYETQQFVYMRLAMALSEYEPKDRRMELVKRFYTEFSAKRLSAPTPNYVNLGTKLRGFASCCLYVVGDSEPSLAIGDHIAYRMTAASAGIGSHLVTRSKGDPVRGGLIQHQGKLPYLASLGKAVHANMQAGRGGACTTYYSGFDPEAEIIAYLRNPRSTEDRRNRDLHYALVTNKLFAEKVARNEDAFSFNVFTAPELTRLFFSADSDGFRAEYERLENDPDFKKDLFKPRDIILTALNEALETGVAYLANIDEMNRHTPFIE